MLTLEEIRDRLEDRKLSVVAQRTGIKVVTLRRIVHGKTPRLYVVERLSAYFTEVQGG
jgi:transcriptional regulator with XRE-family HTH domain